MPVTSLADMQQHILKTADLRHARHAEEVAAGLADETGKPIRDDRATLGPSAAPAKKAGRGGKKKFDDPTQNLL